MDVYVVTISDAESNTIVSIHRTYESALKVWNDERENIIRNIKKTIDALEQREQYNWLKDEMYTRMIKNLQCEDPKIIDNYPHETPNIIKYELYD